MARPHNSKDKNRVFLNNRLKDMYGDDFDPIMRAAEMATLLQAEAMSCEEKDKVTALKASLDGWLKIGRYIHPELKAVEHSVGDDLQDGITELFDAIADEVTR